MTTKKDAIDEGEKKKKKDMHMLIKTHQTYEPHQRNEIVAKLQR